MATPVAVGLPAGVNVTVILKPVELALPIASTSESVVLKTSVATFVQPSERESVNVPPPVWPVTTAAATSISPLVGVNEPVVSAALSVALTALTAAVKVVAMPACHP